MALDGSKIAKVSFGCTGFEAREDAGLFKCSGRIEWEIALFSKPNVLMHR